MAKYSIVLPVYEEEKNLPLCIGMIMEAFESIDEDAWEVIIVEDNGKDKTREIARAIAADFPGKVKVLERPGKMGLGSAYKDALTKMDPDGLPWCTGELVFIMDGDLSHHPNEIPNFIKKQKEGDFDIVTGTRYRHGGGVAGWPFMRKLTSRVANFLATLLLQPGVSDLTGSFRLYRKKVLEDILAENFSAGYAFQMQAMVKAINDGNKVAEVPIKFVERVHGASKIGSGEIAKYLEALVQSFFKY